MHIVFFVCALTSIAAVVLICLFLFANGIPAMKEIGLLNFLTGAKWKPGNDIYGILPMILGSIYITAGAVVIGVPVGLLTAIFMAFYCPKKLYGLLKPCTELLAGIPSIVYGFFGMVVIVPCIRTVAALFGADISGSSILAASVLLGIMILPTVIGVSEAALRAGGRSEVRCEGACKAPDGGRAADGGEPDGDDVQPRASGRAAARLYGGQLLGRAERELLCRH